MFTGKPPMQLNLHDMTNVMSVDLYKVLPRQLPIVVKDSMVRRVFSSDYTLLHSLVVSLQTRVNRYRPNRED